MPDFLKSEGLMDEGSLGLEDALREAKANLSRKVEWLRSLANQHRNAADHLDGEADRLVDESNEHPLQHRDTKVR